MAEFVTKRENIRRWIVIILCLLLAIVMTIITINKNGDAKKIEKGEYDEEGNKTSDKPTRENGYKGDIESLTKILQEREKEYLGYAPKLIKFSDPVGARHKDAGTHDPMGPSGLHVDELKKYLNDWVDLLKKHGKTQYVHWKIGESGEEAGKAAGARLTLVQLFDEIKDIVARIEGEIASTEAETKKFNEEARDKTKQLYDKMREEERKIREELIPKIPKLQAELVQKQIDYAKELAELNRQFAEKQAELEKVQKDNLQEKILLKREEEELVKRKNILTAKVLEEREKMEADGRIIHVDSERQIAYIDLKLKDKVFIGNIFHVFGMQRGGIKYPKGELEIIQISEDSSRAIILRNDKRFPMQKDDFLWDEEYKRGKRKYFAFAGELIGMYSREDLATRLRQVGDDYHNEVKSTDEEMTNYLVLGDKFENDPNYLLGTQYHLRTIKEKDLYHYLGIPWGLRRAPR